MANNEPNPVDVHVGNRIRLRRTVLKITQQQLAKMLGLTFQQIQKYEKGMNRVGASRLWDISRVLDVSMDFFFEDMDAQVINNSPRMLNTHVNMVEERSYSFDDDPMSRKETLELVRAYYKIPNRKIAGQIFDLTVSLSKSSSAFPMQSDD
ncbi:MAG: helix-turn-helix transcriptional regulator [Alphaproteobacteria bacterium]|nr:helix-turn-helix transcriptional regulator [Alphaproteobacteria bacterium]MBR3662760.1 helix-turn-helix transcriptional regulator [Alphaproteobacteria bacterium]